MIVKLLTEQFLEFLRLKVGCTGYESKLVKMSHCWKSHAAAQNYYRKLPPPPLLPPSEGLSDTLDTATVPLIFEPRHEISNSVVCATSKGSDQPAQTRSLIRAFASHLNIL